MANKYLPINIAAKKFRTLVVGGGAVALRKVETLIDYESDLTVVAPEPGDKISYHASKGRIKLETRKYNTPEAAEYGLVISASNDEAVNRQVYEDCQKAGVLVNVVDNPKLCTFIFPAVLKRDALTLSISTDGKAPFLAAHLRIIMENLFPGHWKKIVKLAADFRKKVQARHGDDPKERFASLDRFLEANWKELIKVKNDDELQAELDLLLEPVEEPEEEIEEDAGGNGNRN
ncbi:MAG: bifunctional precorrin-2 dehydrogenase/sirohydrochlorin ferrochelatase [FCB group bacterium]|nr:bifunctional precorrin-2 dehydrogenase/sirohydrochlorin ferrochelatase [FCB group bacterium]